jgi:hypothetical protein
MADDKPGKPCPREGNDYMLVLILGVMVWIILYPAVGIVLPVRPVFLRAVTGCQGRWPRPGGSSGRCPAR